MRLLILASLTLTVPASAAEFPVTDADQQNILAVCEIAARSASIPIEQTAGIAQFCVNWKARIAKAAEPKKEDK